MEQNEKNELLAECRRFAARAGKILAAKHAHASAAESLTGGLIASLIVDVPGASRWFSEGCVTYTDGAKARRLDIDPALIAAHTAVSREVALAMAEGMRRTSGSDISVSVTGLAGPGPDELGRPAGLVYMGGAAGNGSVTKELRLSGSREEIRLLTARAALKLLTELAKLV